MYYLNKETPWMLQVFPSLLPFSWKERIFSVNTSFQHLHWFCFMLLRQRYVQAFHALLVLHLSCSQPTKHPPSWFQLHINLLLCMEKSKVSEETFLWLELTLHVSHFPLVIMAVLPHMHSEMKSVALGGVGDTDPPFWLQWMCWIGPSRLKAVCFLHRLACDSE